MLTSLEFALRYRTRGWQILPLKHGKKEPLTQHGFKDATAVETTIRRWFEQWPTAGVGISTGFVSDLIVIDFDPRNGANPRYFWLQHKKEIGSFPIVKTGGGGEHWYFKYPSKPCPSRKLDGGIDIKSNGGYIVAPPSIHPSGHSYKFVTWKEPPELPELFIRMAEQKQEEKTYNNPPNMGGNANKRARAYVKNMPPSISGSGGHNAAWAAAVALMRGFSLDQEEAMDIMKTEYNPRCLPPWTESELAHKIKQASNARVTKGYLL